MKIAFISGPADAPEIYHQWAGEAGQEYFGTNYLKQFLQVAKDTHATSLVITWHGDQQSEFHAGDFTFVNRPITTAGGARYYIDHLLWHLRVLPMLIRFRPDVLLLTGNQNFWWLLSPVRWLGADIVISYHAVVWQQFIPKSRPLRFFVAANGRFILRHAKAILETSHAIRRQIEAVLGRHAGKVPILGHLPTWSPRQFEGIAKAKFPRTGPFRTFFMGRIEENKGIYDIVEVAARLQREAPGRYLFDLCGSGSQLETLRRRVSERGLDDVVKVHGFASSARVKELLSASHACIVPTRTSYEAGFEMTCAESILAGRPLITSVVCPAIEYLQPATIEVAPDDAQGYADAIVKLSADEALYMRLRDACPALQPQFYDPENSWYAKMRQALAYREAEPRHGRSTTAQPAAVSPAP